MFFHLSNNFNNSLTFFVKQQVYMTSPQGYKTCFMLNSTEHEISNAHKN